MLNVILKPHRTSLKAGTPDAQKLFAMLKLIPKAEVAGNRPPLAMALVIDTSGSMRERGGQAENKLDQAIRAAHALLDDDRLNPHDLVSLVQFDTSASTLLPLGPLGTRTAAHQAVEALRQFSGQTYMARGLDCAARALATISPQTAKRVLLLTDGQTVDDSQCRRIAGGLAEANTPIIALGIGSEYNEELLIELAQVSQGRPYHLQNMTQFAAILNDEVGVSVREVVTDLRAAVLTVKGATIDSLTRVYPSLSEVGIAAQPFRLGNISAGDYTVFILELTVAGIPRPPSRARVAQINLSAAIAGIGEYSDIPSQEVYVAFTTDEAAIAEVDEEVLGYVQQKSVDRMVQEAVRLAATDPARARQTLQAASGMTQRVGNAGMTKVLDNALDELNRTGSLSPNTAKTIRAGGRTKTMKTGASGTDPAMPSADEIRRLTGA